MRETGQTGQPDTPLGAILKTHAVEFDVAPCPECNGRRLWVDGYEVARCLHCCPPMSTGMIRQRIAISQQGRQRPHWPTYCDCDEPSPPDEPDPIVGQKWVWCNGCQLRIGLASEIE